MREFVDRVELTTLLAKPILWWSQFEPSLKSGVDHEAENRRLKRELAPGDRGAR